jgi:hypothetical protein
MQTQVAFKGKKYKSSNYECTTVALVELMKGDMILQIQEQRLRNKSILSSVLGL